MDITLLVIFTLISASAHQGANYIVYSTKAETPVYAPRWITTLGGFLFVKTYLFLGIPIACLNGYLIYEYKGLIIAGIGTFFGTSFFRFWGRRGWSTLTVAITLIWTVVNLFRITSDFAPAPDVPMTEREHNISAEAYYNRGVANAELGKYAEAIANFDTAIKRDPDFMEAYYNRAVAKGVLGQHADALPDYNTVIDLDPDFMEAYYNRGSTKAELGRYVEAITDFDTAIQLNPKNVRSYQNRGKVNAELGKYSEAIADFNAAIQLNPNYAEAYSSRGIAKANFGQNRAAKQDLRPALRLATQAGDVELKKIIQEILQRLDRR